MFIYLDIIWILWYQTWSCIDRAQMESLPMTRKTLSVAFYSQTPVQKQLWTVHPAASCHIHRPPFVSSIHRKAQQKKKLGNEKKVDLIHLDFLVAKNYSCSYASTSHIYTHISRNTQHSYENTILCNWSENVIAFLIQKCDVFWYSVNV